MTPIEQLRAQARRDLQHATAMREKAIAIKEDALDMRLRLWLKRLRPPRLHPGGDTALEWALDAALSVASADCANIQLVHPRGRGLVLTAQRGFRQPLLDFFACVDDRQTACGLAWQEQRPVVVPDILCSLIFVQTRGLDVILEAGIRAVTSTPLLGPAGQRLGMLSVHYRQPRPHRDADLTRFQRLATAVAALIDGRSTM